MQVHQSWFGQLQLRRSWLRAFVRAACLLPLGMGLSFSTQAQSERPPLRLPTAPAEASVLNLDTQLVSLTVTVTDKQGRFLPGLARSAFTVYEDQISQEVSFFAADDLPAAVAIVFDLSGSMRPEKFQRARLALARFLQNCHPADEYSLIGFNEKAWVAVERTTDAQQLLRQFSLTEPKGHTALYDAVALGLQQLERSQLTRRVLLLVSDGEDNRSRASFRDLKRKAQESAALIYAIGITDYALKHSQGEYLLDDLAKLTGGKAFFPRDGEAMSAAFEKIALELRQQYSLGYTPSNFVADGKWRKLKVKVANPAGTAELVVRTRSGYYANPARAARQVEAALENGAH